MNQSHFPCLIITVKLAYKDHPRDQQNVVLMHRWSLYAGSITWKLYIALLIRTTFYSGPVKCGPYKQVVFIYRWSLEQVWLYLNCCCSSPWPEVDLDDYSTVVYALGGAHNLFSFLVFLTYFLSNHPTLPSVAAFRTKVRSEKYLCKISFIGLQVSAVDFL